MDTKYIITDLDNTLYDWVTFFSKSFSAMLQKLTKILDIDESTLICEFKELHQKYHSIERPFTMLELPSVKLKYKDKSNLELLDSLNEASHSFNSMRKKTLCLYETVIETFIELERKNYKIFGCTESSIETGYYRLVKLGIASKFKRIYFIDSNYEGHPDPERRTLLEPSQDLLIQIPNNLKKPDPQILEYICQRENIEKTQVIYVGDSLLKDIYMANQAGIASVWARYGTSYDPGLWDVLVKVTHWTNEDVIREKELRNNIKEIIPDFTINSFDQLLQILI